MTGRALFFDMYLVSWTSRIQRYTPLPTSEDEHIVITDAIKDALFVRDILGILARGMVAKSIVVLEENEGTIS